ncbi:MAG TPA: TM0106 family RecB-like putative nuclease [Candidatus Dormibacteraeota bacterium]|nr:TM0106 family RecB-like putative nuclease [Candidatus Dormibacteraeota bacterium]
MYNAADVLVLSATDLVAHLECEHLTQLERRAALGEIKRPVRVDPSLDLVASLGEEHERKHLDRYRALGFSVAVIEQRGYAPDDLQRAEAKTLDAMRSGVDVIYQGTFFDGRWTGRADLLVKVAEPSGLGAHGYEVVDAKLARHAKTRALLQVAVYSDQLTRLQGRPPRHLRLILGDDSEQFFRVDDFISYARTALARLEAVLAESPIATYPDKVDHCSICRWKDVCDQKRRNDDHLSWVAGIRRDQIRRLHRAGITTTAALAESRNAVEGIGPAALQRIRTQAELQVAARETGERLHQLVLEQTPGLGLGALPEPSVGDLFFDMEGDPYVADGGLEYLFGAVGQESGSSEYQSWWAHDRAEEKAAFEGFVDFVIARWERDPKLHIYHYASYEPEAAKRLMGRHGTREDEVDRMLRGGLFIDLYQVLRQGVRISEESYSLKNVERFYMPERTGSVMDAGSSIVEFERWRREGDKGILTDIKAYNRVDCESTVQLRGWLEECRREAIARGLALSRPQPRDAAPPPELAAAEVAVRELAEALLTRVPQERSERNGEQQARWLLAQSLSWHRREAKADWWAYFQRLAMSDEELLEDREAIGGLEYLGDVDWPKRSVVRRYHFDPSQEYKISIGDTPEDPRFQQPAGTVVALDPFAGALDLKRGRGRPWPHPTSLVPARPYFTTEQRQAVQRLAQLVLQGGFRSPGSEAASDLLLRSEPRIAGGQPGMPMVAASEDPGAAARVLVGQLDSTCLPIQGPPGTGKTYTGARMILDLVAAGRRVGVTATSHKVIGNLLLEVMRASREEGRMVRVTQKCEEHEFCGDPGIGRTSDNGEVLAALAFGSVDVVGGTPWLWSRQQFQACVNTLFVDEAGQMSLANVLSVAGASRNLVLLGDPRQLTQPSKGAHPPGADVSALDHVLGASATITPEQGIFLATTWRMHRDVCGFVSAASYEGRLHPQESCNEQWVRAPGSLTGTGIRFLPVKHWGNRTSSDEEAVIVVRLFKDLLSGEWRDRIGIVRPVRLENILVVAPFNAQVSLVQAMLPQGARVGTVDKFQGQEAPAVIYTLATSSPDDLPRIMEFLFSLNRLNVAVSRAQSLATVICTPELLRVRAKTPEQLRLANALCMLVETATEVMPLSPA